jgi:hypothetical protein
MAAAMLAILALATRSISACALRTLTGGGLESLRKNLGLH